jgi:hypothetical protein
MRRRKIRTSDLLKIEAKRPGGEFRRVFFLPAAMFAGVFRLDGGSVSRPDHYPDDLFDPARSGSSNAGAVSGEEFPVAGSLSTANWPAALLSGLS